MKTFVAIAVALVCAVAAAPHASAQGALAITASTPTRGWIDVAVRGPAGVSVQLAEVADGVAAPIATVSTGAGDVRPARALAWRFDRRDRRIVADARAADGTPLHAETTIRTPSCAERFAVTLRPRTAVVARRSLVVAVRDRWRMGRTDARACVRVRGTSACRDVRLPSRVRLRPRRSGPARFELRGDGFRIRERLEVRGRHARLRVLATGDSMIQLVDHRLRDGLGRRAQVRSDARVSTGVSKTLMLNWVAHARRQAAKFDPHVTVMFIGANDGFAIHGVPCCDDPWVRAYAARVRAMMRSYHRRGAGRVYWLTLPAPRDSARQRIYRAVNRAIRSAAQRFDAEEVAVVDLGRIFTPGGRFRASIHGRVVRQSDGIHLNNAGAAIAARAVIRRMRADGFR
jgi:lysophospholipase L1-like esterase